MTLLEPSLFLNRLVVTRHGSPVYDEAFHRGVNIIRGDNGAGKTTIMDFIFYALGGEQIDFRPEAALCDTVFAELAINGEVITVRREVEGLQRRPLGIFWAGLSEASRNSVRGWEHYPYASMGDRESFSVVLFNSLGLPIAASGLASKITMHQILRLIYVDQETSPSLIFRSEEFDSPLVRSAVGDLLLGIDSDELYEAELSLKEKRERLTEKRAEFRTLRTVLLEPEAPLQSPEAVENVIASIEAERQEHFEILQQLLERTAGTRVGKRRATRLQELRQETRAVNREIASVEEEVDSLDFELQDTSAFIEALQGDLAALDEGQSLRTALGRVDFAFCPGCYSPLEGEVAESVCPLCKTRTDEGINSSGTLKLRRDLVVQIQESKTLQAERKQRREEQIDKLGDLKGQEAVLRKRYRELRQGTVSDEDARIAELNRRIGYLDRELELRGRELRLAERVHQIKLEIERLTKEVASLENRVEELQETRELREADARSAIETKVVGFLKEDLAREERFMAAESVDFSFRSNKITVMGAKVLGASSMVFLKNSFHAALWEVSLEKTFMRYPRLCIIDNVEDKGMEEERSHRFQRLLVRASESFPDVEHQVIFSTSKIAPELERSPWTVGDYYTLKNKSLKLPASRGV